MLTVDLHSHTHFSRCGLHSIIEMLTQAKTLGMEALAITDHALTLGGHLSSSFFNRLEDPIPGITLFKGVECNVLDEEGNIDTPLQWLDKMDLVLLGVHPNIDRDLAPQRYAHMLKTAVETNPYIDILVHPDCPGFVVDFPALAETALQYGIALELNNSKSRPDFGNAEVTRDLIRVCRDRGCRMAVSSDAHALNEIGDDSHVRPLLEELGFPEHLVVNHSLASAKAFVQERRDRRQAVVSPS